MKKIKMDYNKESLKMHEKYKGKLEVKSKVPLNNKDDLSLAYTPGVAEPCKEIFKDKENAYKYTIKGNSVAIVSDGSSVLGLGNIGGYAAIPVMEGKALLFKEFAGIDAFPICLKTQNPDEIVEIVKNIEPVFGGINLEDIKAPECFYIEDKLKKELQIPVMHDDQHGTAIVILAALINSLKLSGKKFSDIKIVVSGAGAAGLACVNLLVSREFINKFGNCHDLILVDSKGIIYKGRDDMNEYKKRVLGFINKKNMKGDLTDAFDKADVFIGVSKGNIVNEKMIKKMNTKPIVFAMANPVPEIMPDKALEAGAFIIGTGRSDFPNQINNVLAFPGVFRVVLDSRAKEITTKMKINAAIALAGYVKDLNREKILPNALDKNVANVIAGAIKNGKV